MEQVSWTIGVVNLGVDGALSESASLLTCSGSCIITQRRSFTPILYYLQPRVMYNGSEVDFIVDPKNAVNYQTAPYLAFTEARVNKYTIDFNDFVDESF